MNTVNPRLPIARGTAAPQGGAVWNTICKPWQWGKKQLDVLNRARTQQKEERGRALAAQQRQTQLSNELEKVSPSIGGQIKGFIKKGMSSIPFLSDFLKPEDLVSLAVNGGTDLAIDKGLGFIGKTLSLNQECRKILQQEAFQGCKNFAGTNYLAGVNFKQSLPYIDFTIANLTSADLSPIEDSLNPGNKKVTNIDGLKLAGTVCEKINMSGVQGGAGLQIQAYQDPKTNELTPVNFTDAKLIADFPGVNFLASILDLATLEGNFTGAAFGNNEMGASMASSKLAGNFSNVHFGLANLQGADFSRVSSLEGSSFASFDKLIQQGTLQGVIIPAERVQELAKTEARFGNPDEQQRLGIKILSPEINAPEQQFSHATANAALSDEQQYQQLAMQQDLAHKAHSTQQATEQNLTNNPSPRPSSSFFQKILEGVKKPMLLGGLGIILGGYLLVKFTRSLFGTKKIKAVAPQG